MQADEVEGGLPRKSPCRDHRRIMSIAFSSEVDLKKTRQASVLIQIRTEKVLACFDRAHMPHPLHEIEGYGNQSKDRNKTHQDLVVWRRVEAEAERGKHQCCERNLRHRIELRYHQRLHRNRLAEYP